MKKLMCILLCMTSWYAYSEEEKISDKTWYEYTQVLLPEIKPTQLDTKLKLLELVSLRQWQVKNQTLDSFEMTLKKCNVKISFNNEDITISHDGFKTKNHGGGYSKAPICSKNWLSNIDKDINAALRILSLQQEAINLDKASHKNQ
ncbi:hypothetical protein [Aliivibrio fischeri]|uniref:hypothetical protein n=1 Tax=Aliivibrio fischeri TaxID=668 RepID=UPI0012DA472D|nr:hypothetical protein [Aliivibrio fischeri]MUK65073.1 hypothetical protein [Aliivibrio fischeri]